MQDLGFVEISPSTKQPLRIFRNNEEVLQERFAHPEHNSKSIVKSTFLPVGYPDSVRSEYLEYQVHDSLQALCSYLRSVLCTHALLVGAGVGSASASALAAAMTWVMRDGIGMLGSICFGTYFARHFGNYVKEWRLFADVMNDIGQSLDILSAILPSQYYFFVISASVLCRAMCGVSAGAAKMCITNHFALCNNAADLTIKENAQETFITLLGMIAGMIISQIFGNDAFSSHFAGIVFVALTALHIYANYRAVRCLAFSTINRPRLFLLLYHYLQEDTKAMSIERINQMESFWLTFRCLIYGPSVGIPLSTALHKSPNDVSSRIRRFQRLAKLNAKYVLLSQQGGKLCAVMKQGATKEDQMKAFVHTQYTLLAKSIEGGFQPRPVFFNDDELHDSYTKFDAIYSDFLKQIKTMGWNAQPSAMEFDMHEWVYDSALKQKENSSTSKKVM